jgi:next to BRCA1 gene 1 protein
MPVMGDQVLRSKNSSRSVTSSATRTSTATTVQTTSVQTVVDVKPSEPTVMKEEIVAEPEVIKEEPEQPAPAEKAAVEQDLVAFYVRDTVTDGTILPPNHVFEQTWVLQNAGNVAWPAGCSVKFVGGDYMGHVDSNHPAGISELVSASESTICYEPLAPGQEFPFTVLLRTPAREGKIISYWRLTTKDGYKFGHRLWCDVSVRAPKAKEVIHAKEVKVEEAVPGNQSAQSSQMIFPKLEKESPESSIHNESSAKEHRQVEQEADDFEDCEDDEWDGSDDGFMTDEEYDILDASDEEYLDEQQKLLHK